MFQHQFVAVPQFRQRLPNRRILFAPGAKSVFLSIGSDSHPSHLAKTELTHQLMA
jgi:hypothetical protein